jgi:rhodanese-related sulfurtransferase
MCRPPNISLFDSRVLFIAMRRLSVNEINAYLHQADQPPLLLDVREPWEYDICHLENSQLIPMRNIPAAIADLDLERETIVICHHGIRSRQVAMFLEHQGFSNVINMEGGMAAWTTHVDRNMPTY